VRGTRGDFWGSQSGWNLRKYWLAQEMLACKIRFIQANIYWVHPTTMSASRTPRSTTRANNPPPAPRVSHRSTKGVPKAGAPSHVSAKPVAKKVRKRTDKTDVDAASPHRKVPRQDARVADQVPNGTVATTVSGNGAAVSGNGAAGMPAGACLQPHHPSIPTRVQPRHAVLSTCMSSPCSAHGRLCLLVHLWLSMSLPSRDMHH